ncbi:hypothetical protein A1O7_06283 [Cladophialophora yegresii CBS 114405]|uniref:Uncharacterized protein n=1 Tax=Cladophialophora yegresii CBS 114405 TaxID=1182544 RepID=W9VTI6_9EURO|nr:uncharacterized protein A1O7_06283 [Cladophialophora yegresii CBS 114405]EXJ58853.1 hypothetical protein A1O7_06283 [Cladophialophora yegresii CBS 114405]
MPSKYSHGVVLATYSSRGIISSPNDEQLDYLRSFRLDSPTPTIDQPGFAASGRAPLAPPIDTHGPSPPASNRTSKSWRNRSRPVSMSETIGLQSRNGAANDYQTLGGPHDIALRRRSRTLIVDSDEDDVEDDFRSQKVLGCAPTSPAASAPKGARLSFPFRLASPTLSPMRQPQSSPGTCGRPAGTGVGFTQLVRKNVQSLPTQKYELESDQGDQARSPRPRSLVLHTSSVSRSEDFAEPLLSIQEFLGFPAHLKQQELVAVGELGAPSREQASASTLGTASPTPGVGGVPPDLSASPTSPSHRRGHVAFTDTSDDEDDGNVRSEHHLEPFVEAKSFSALETQNGAHRHAILDLTEEEPLDTNGKLHTVPRPATPDEDATPLPSSNQQDGSIEEAYFGRSDDGNEGPMLCLEVQPGRVDPVRHDDKAAPQNSAVLVPNQDRLNTHVADTPVEPDFSHFLDGEELGDPMDGPLIDGYLKDRSYQAADKDILSHEVIPNVSVSSSPHSTRSDNDRAPEPSTPVRQRMVSFGSREHNATITVGRATCATGETGPLPPAGSTTSPPLGREKYIQKLKSEEEMRMQNPTPIPSPAAYKARHKLTGSQSSRATQTSIALSNIGMPSVVRSPQQKKQKQKQKQVDASPKPKSPRPSNTRQKTDPVEKSRRWWRDSHSRPASYSNPANPSGDASAVAARIHGGDESSHIRTLPTARLYADLSSEFESPPTSVTPRSQTANRRSQPATPRRNLMIAFDDISVDHSIESEPDLSVSYADDLDDLAKRAPQGPEDDEEEEEREGYHSAPDSDSNLDAALPPPDISRHPPLDRDSPHSTRTRPEPHRSLSSPTSRSWRAKLKTTRKTKRKPMSKPEAEPQPVSTSISTPDDRSTDIVLRFLDPDQRPRSSSGLGPRRQRPHAVRANTDVGAGTGPTGPGKTTGIARLEAIMERAEEEARANRKKKGMSGLWRRFKRRT